MVLGKNCNGEAQMEGPFSTTISARMLIPAERTCPPVRERERETDRETAGSNHHSHDSTAELSRRKKAFHAD